MRGTRFGAWWRNELGAWRMPADGLDMREHTQGSIVVVAVQVLAAGMWRSVHHRSHA